MGLESVELVMDVEEAFGIQLSEAKTAEVLTVGELAWSKVKHRDSEAWTKPKVREAVHQHVHEILDVASCQDSDHLVEDLGMA